MSGKENIMEHRISISSIEDFRVKLIEEERSLATIDKYMRDIRFFFSMAWKRKCRGKRKGDCL